MPKQKVKRKAPERTKTPLGQVERTDRGFEVIAFQDRNANACSLGQSSLADYVLPGSSAVWLGRQTSQQMHLDRKQVKDLIAVLGVWVKSGSFVKPKTLEKQKGGKK